MYIYITRHGESDTEKYGGLDPYLTPKGHTQASLLAEQLKCVSLDAIYSSPLVRALQTASYVAQQQKNCRSVEIIPNMYETGTDIGYGFKTACEIKACCDNLIIPDSLPCVSCADNPEQSLARARSIIEKLKAAYGEDDKILLVAHGSFNTYLILAALDFPIAEGFNYSQDNTGLTLIRYLTESDGSKRTKLVFLNDTSHLYRNRLEADK